MKKQQGLSFIRFLATAVLVVVVGIIGFKVIPAYTQYLSIKRMIGELARGHKGEPPQAIRDAFNRNAEIGYITDVTAGDLKISQVGSTTVIIVHYEKVVPLLGNANLLFRFDINQTSSGDTAGG